MSGNPDTAIHALDRRFLLDYPGVAARRAETMPPADAAALLGDHPAGVLAPVIAALTADSAARLLIELPDELVAQLLSEMSPNDSARIVNGWGADLGDRYLGSLAPAIAREINRLRRFPPDSAGQLMDTQVAHFRDNLTVDATLHKLRETRARATRSLFTVDRDNKLSGRVTIQEIAVSPARTRLKEIAEPIKAFATGVMPRATVVDLLERHRLADIPVVDVEGHLLGIIYHSTLIQAIQEDASADIQTMVGASKDERALSSPMFAVRRRLPWLQINLLTAFLAAAVVGLFEDTIARFTALAVLLPVVAGQSGNAGAQALAVTMRGLALREINLRHWRRVTLKEIQAGLLNGIAVAITCGIGVYIWSGSLGMVLVIASSMVLAMIAAGFAGAIVPISLTKLGQDPAQSSSIILTTVTDVAGFLSFLGIATLLASLL